MSENTLFFKQSFIVLVSFGHWTWTEFFKTDTRMSLDTLALFLGSLRTTLITSISVKRLKEKWSSLNFSLIASHIALNSAKVSGSFFKLRFLIILQNYLSNMVAFFCVSLRNSPPLFNMIWLPVLDLSGITGITAFQKVLLSAMPFISILAK